MVLCYDGIAATSGFGAKQASVEEVILYRVLERKWFCVVYYRGSGFVSCTREEVVLYRVLERKWFCIVTTEDVALCHALLKEGCAIRKSFDTNKRQCRFNNNNDITGRCHSTCLACM